MDVFSSLKYFYRIGVHVDKKLFFNTLFNHHNFSTIYSFIDTLNKFDIENYAVSISIDELRNNPLPVFSILKEVQKELVLVTRVNEDSVEYIKEYKPVKESIADFIQKWTGLGIYIIPQKKNKFENSKILYLLIFFLFLLLPFTVYALSPLKNISISLLLGLSIAGWLISYSLLKYSLAEGNILTNIVCGKNKIIDCNKVLTSKAASLFNIHMYDIGIVYFSVSIIWLILSQLQSYPTVINLWGTIALLSIPYCLFSLYYQFFQIKKLCALCMFIIAVLFVQGAIVVYKGLWINSISIKTFIYFGYFVLVTGIISYLYFYIKNKYEKHRSIKDDSDNYFQIKRDTQVFDLIYKSQQPFNIDRFRYSLPLSTSENSLSIICVLSLQCNPCAKAFSEIVKILNTSQSLPNISIIIDGINKDSDDISRKALVYFHNIYKTYGEKVLIDMLQTWYNQKDDPTSFIIQEINQTKLDENKDWIENYIHNLNNSIRISYTPTFLINGKALPNYYTIRDIIYHCQFRLENQTKNVTL